MDDVEYDYLRIAEDSHWWFWGRRERALQLARRFRLGGRLLDLGCGTGANLEALAGCGTVVGLDLHLGAARETRKRTRASVVVGDALRLPFGTSSFDAITAFDLFEHLPSDGEGMREVARVLRPGGHLLLTVPSCPPLFGPHDRALHHFRRYGRAECLALSRRAGLSKAEFLGYYGGFAFPALLAWRAFQKILLNGRGKSDVGRPVPSWINRMLLVLAQWEGRVVSPVGGTLIALFRKDAPA
jgi:SAM-dependent methyltransferase